MEFVEATYTELRAIKDIVELSHTLSSEGKAESKQDWKFIKILYQFWKIHQTSEYRAFMKEQNYFRQAYKENKHGIAEEKGGASLQHLNSMPETFHYLFMRYFPKQKFTRDFFRKLQEEIPDFRIHEYYKI
jgi:hypothetical protein